MEFNYDLVNSCRDLEAGNLSTIVANMLFKLQSHAYITFWTSTLGKGMNPFILPAMG